MITAGILLFFFIYGAGGFNTQHVIPITLNDLKSYIEEKKIKNMVIWGSKAVIDTVDGTQCSTLLPNDTSFIHSALFNKITVQIREPIAQIYTLTDLFRSLIEYGMWIAFILWVGRRSAIGHSSKTKDEIKSNITFADVAGMKDIKNDLMEILETMKNSKHYVKFGCTVPKGAILYGPPGNGKTFIARALAGEGQTTFFSASASEFIEIFVGTGPSRVRELFKRAREHAPSIVFIDEVDALGKRGGSGFGGDSERNSTINEMLVQMDGIQSNEMVFVFFATNKIEDLDKALIRAGRIDRKVMIGNPEFEDRLAILQLYVGKIHASVDIDLVKIARGTIGFSRAEMTTLINESKFKAVKDGGSIMSMKHLEETKDSMILGEKSKKKGRKFEIENTAYHECGHAFLFYYFRTIVEPIYKATIVPRGQALGVVMPEPDEDKVSHSKEYLESMIMVGFAGRMAEEIFFGKEKVTSGCASDIAMARNYAEHYVRYGMSDNYGLVFYSEDFSMKEKNDISNEVRKLLRRLEQQTKKIILENKVRIERLTRILLDVETLTGAQIKYILENEIYLPESVQIQRNIKYK